MDAGSAVLFASVADVVAWVGRDLGRSRWRVVERSHVDAVPESPDATVHEDVPGTLALPMVPLMIGEVFRLHGLRSVTYGLNKVRFPDLVRPGETLRARLELRVATPCPGGAQVLCAVTIEREGGGTCCVAEAICRVFLGRRTAARPATHVATVLDLAA